MQYSLTPVRTRLGVLVLAFGLALTGLLALGALHTRAAAATTTANAVSVQDNGSHDPIGRVRIANPVSGGVLFAGFAFDPDYPATNVKVSGVIDGVPLDTAVTTFIPRPQVQATYPRAGATTGYALTVPVPAGRHTVCVVAHNLGLGLWSVLRCVVTPIGTGLSASDAALHSPVGGVYGIWPSGGQVHASGWSSDPDFVQRRARVVMYVDGSPFATVDSQTMPNPRPAGSGPRSAWRFDLPISSVTHEVCLWVVNVGFGSNHFLGCRAIDPRGPAGSGAVATPAANTTAMTEALKHRGQPYVWAASGPRSFDCSGLVMYAYAKANLSTVHQSEQQFSQARLIPATRAVPGDLVFFHDSQGDVYHVALYVSPGKAFAAIDESLGVNYQTIWDPSVVTYGSFTHI